MIRTLTLGLVVAVAGTASFAQSITAPVDGQGIVATQAEIANVVVPVVTATVFLTPRPNGNSANSTPSTPSTPGTTN